jgi:transcriptional regulator with XRE-family HTH domain
MTKDHSQSLGECLKHWRLRKGLPLEAIAFKTRIPLKYLRALEANDFSELPPIDTFHLTLGDSLRRYREARQFSLEDIAEQTRVPLSYLKALEDNNTLHMPEAPVIARSFVDAYLNCLGLQESQKEEVLIQFAKLAEAVYRTPEPEPSEQATHSSEESSAHARASVGAFRGYCHERTLAAYWKIAKWRTASCLWMVSASRTIGTWTGILFRNIMTVSSRVGRTAYHTMTPYAARMWKHTLAGMSRLADRYHARQALTPRDWQLRSPFFWMHRDTVPPTEWYAARDHVSDAVIPSLSLAATHANHASPKTAGKMWVWMVQYGMTVLLLLLLGSTAANIPLFKETVLIDAKLDVSHLVEFLGYGGALTMIWLMSRKAGILLDRDRSGLAFLRPMVVPLTALLVTSGSYKIALVLMNPFLSKADRLAYDWTCIVLILVSTLWVILTWFFRSAPMLESLEATGRGKQPGRGSVPSHCPHCGTSVPDGMKFCGRCGIANTASQE